MGFWGFGVLGLFCSFWDLFFTSPAVKQKVRCMSWNEVGRIGFPRPPVSTSTGRARWVLDLSPMSHSMQSNVRRGWALGGNYNVAIFIALFKLIWFGTVKQYPLNIARGTTDPEIDSETWTKLGNNMAPLALIANLATRWRHLTFSHLITFSH